MPLKLSTGVALPCGTTLENRLAKVNHIGSLHNVFTVLIKSFSGSYG